MKNIEYWDAEKLEDLALNIATGGKRRIVAPPYSGKSMFLSAVTESLSSLIPIGSVLHMDGRAITETSLESDLTSLINSIKTIQENSGYCVLIFDHYGHAMRRSKSAKLQAALYKTLINSESANQVGFLAAHRNRELVNLQIRTSPFIGLVDVDFLVDYVDKNQISESISSEVGFLPGFVARSRGSDAEYSTARWSKFWDPVSLETITMDLVGTSQIFDSSNDFVVEEIAESVGLTVNQMEKSQFRMVISESERMRGNWPKNINESSLWFSVIVNEVGPAYWYDRFMLSSDTLPSLLPFLRRVHQRGQYHLRLISEYRSEWANYSEVMRCARQIFDEFGIEIRIKNYSSGYIHDRHLKSVSGDVSYNMPQASEILCTQLQSEGSMAGKGRLDLNYAEVWAAARRLI